MAIKQVKVHVEQLQRGMFVSRLDRPWTHTPFALQGFYIRDLEEIRQLQRYCSYVYVDMAKTVGVVGASLRQLARQNDRDFTGAAPKSARGKERSPVAIPCRPVKVSHQAYPPPQPARKAAPRARKLFRQLQHCMHQVMVQLRSGAPLPLRQVGEVVEELVDNVLRSPDAAAWLARVREKDEYTFSHSLRAGIWAVIFGRHIGLRRHELVQLGTACLLKDVGKMEIPDEVLRSSRRDPVADGAYRRFVEHSVKMLSAEPGLDPQVLDIIHCHCERHDGSGFPRGLSGGKIPVLARMCGIVTFYDEATNPRGEHFPVAPSRAVAQLYDLRGRGFHEQLVVEFIQAIGLYPTGTEVELSTGEVAVVVEQTYHHRLRPRVAVVLDRARQPLPKPRLLDLAAEDDRKQRLIDQGKLSPADKITIVQDLEPRKYPQVDVAAVRDQYLLQGGGLSAVLSRLFAS
ncbi:HD-GYP domain-containing protein [Microbulbifer yueqingensis]|uniref:HD-GYP domain, c-di-GMP phosphodiesterase class II (Or its inactivated variant) n=1 Tax=Microbulbifer yueqingensis TaxID=658219 RepID=A0A1G9CZM4_9GAMM|nr:HD domain-containing phosphohydrolase [Microbulbifer yueqingensis]SDK57120.1 HD-GYP domain, c-di-GMP phosphodiesterase class II (or its inactivated variant) [Microbulbifer yueqingensis]